jgi:hypothetical protein
VGVQGFVIFFCRERKTSHVMSGRASFPEISHLCVRLKGQPAAHLMTAVSS